MGQGGGVIAKTRCATGISHVSAGGIEFACATTPVHPCAALLVECNSGLSGGSITPWAQVNL